VLNELDALVNIDLNKRELKNDQSSLNIVRIGTSGSLQQDIPVDSMVLGKYGIGFEGLLHFYQADDIFEKEMENAFIDHTNSCANPKLFKSPSYMPGLFWCYREHNRRDEGASGAVGAKLMFLLDEAASR